MFLIGASVGFLGADQAATAKIEKCIIHQLHALLFPSLNNSRKHEGLGFADHVGDGRRIGQCFQREHASLAIGSRNQLLTNDAAERFAHHDPDLFLLIRRKDVEQSIKRARCAPRMQRSQNQMAGLSRGDRERDRFQITHFSNHDHVGIFAE